jgi:hypothetical protein
LLEKLLRGLLMLEPVLLLLELLNELKELKERTLLAEE